ncbi:hypothetical protein [Mycolicibacterium peregrinum]|nr:hypothetical protein [Mycolicibacterium peregrinum]
MGRTSNATPSSDQGYLGFDNGIVKTASTKDDPSHPGGPVVPMAADGAR